MIRIMIYKIKWSQGIVTDGYSQSLINSNDILLVAADNFMALPISLGGGGGGGGLVGIFTHGDKQ